jgi:meso-butanediol dehydrogenase / (S,S)-butanediol dehydrogenase / diacetyl reductase
MMATPDYRFDGRVVCVTGASRGVGRRAVELFLEYGARVVAADRLGEELHAAFDWAGKRVALVEADLTEVAACERVIDAALDSFQRLDVLFNNAGITVRCPAEQTSDEIWRMVLDTNLRSVFCCCRAALPHMRRQGGGAIVNNASINAIRGNLDLVAYSASKGGVVAMTRALATEFASANIRVNALLPGTIDTPMTDEYLAAAGDVQELQRALIAKHPLGRLASADDVARAAVFLASDNAAFITGVGLPVDGGRHLV